MTHLFNGINVSHFSINGKSGSRYYIMTDQIESNVDVHLPPLIRDDQFVFADHQQTLTNKSISSTNNMIDIDASSIASGIIPVEHGGTGQSSYQPGTILVGGPTITSSSINIDDVATKQYVDDKMNISTSRSIADQLVHITINDDYIATLDDHVIGVDCPRPCTITFPSGKKKRLTVVDESGNASVNHITIVPTDGLVLGKKSFVINCDYGSVQFYCNGTNWFVG